MYWPHRGRFFPLSYPRTNVCLASPGPIGEWTNVLENLILKLKGVDYSADSHCSRPSSFMPVTLLIDFNKLRLNE